MTHDLLRVVRNQNFLAGLEELLEALPFVADDWGRTCRGFEQADARRVPEPFHVAASDIDGVAGAGVERRVVRRRYVFQVEDVRRPLQRGVARAADYESLAF